MPASLVSHLRSVGLALLALWGVAGTSNAALVSAVEFYHLGFDHFFITTSATEIALLDAGTIVGWSRTGLEFKVEDAPGPGLVPVCRFFSASFAPKSSHFYTPFADECAKVKANRDWTFEAEAFYVPLPNAAATCAAGFAPVYRFYNQGQGEAPNHAYTPYASDRTIFVGRGWISEGLGADGVVFCVPSYLGLAFTRTQQMSGGIWEFRFTSTVTHTLRTGFGAAEPGDDPDLPYGAYATDPSVIGVAIWEPYAGKIGVVLIDVVTGNAYLFLFDFDGGNTVRGCAFVLDTINQETLGPCYPFTGQHI